MLQIGYRQLAALLLGTAITVTSLGFVYSWHSHFVDYQNQITVKSNVKQTTAMLLDSAAERHMALTYCANQLLKQRSHVFNETVDNSKTSDKTDSLIFYDGEQEIDVEQILDNDVAKQLRYRLRHHHARQFEFEVIHD